VIKIQISPKYTNLGKTIMNGNPLTGKSIVNNNLQARWAKMSRMLRRLEETTRTGSSIYSFNQARSKLTVTTQKRANWQDLTNSIKFQTLDQVSQLLQDKLMKIEKLKPPPTKMTSQLFTNTIS
jgi:hypothetical protein